MRFRGPLANSYPAAVLLVVFALIPYLALTSAMTPLMPVLSKSLGLSQQSLQLTNGMANAAYAFGTVLAVQFAVHLPARRMLLVYATLSVISSVLTALAFTPGFFIAGHILQGLFTSLMLIAAVPPLVVGWPASKMPWTAGVMNMCIFGAVALGPVIGGVQAGALDWRPLFWIVAGAGAIALLFVLLTYEDQPAQDRSAPWDFVAIVLAGGGSAAAFFGASELETHPMLSSIVFIPLLCGVAMIVTLIVHQYSVKRPLMPVRQLATTKPVAGILAAMSAGAASVAVIELTQQALKSTTSPIHGAMLFWPQFGGALMAAMAFALLVRTRWLVAVVFSGLALLSGGIAILTGVATGPHVLVVVGSGLVGLGVGSAVAPALFVAGFSVSSAQIQRVFALIELLRAVAAFLAAPIILHLAMTVDGGSRGAGVNTAMWVCFAIAVGGGLLALYMFILGRARLERPNLERWLSGDGPAWQSPPLAAGIRGERSWREAPVRTPDRAAAR
ncbi:MAG TPA: MFS transporter [Solirubrobacteraceae bacterium]|jgi:MFS family permease|nr:MFS transporter [Solirubrobacteraceae bacterium]